MTLLIVQEQDDMMILSFYDVCREKWRSQGKEE